MATWTHWLRNLFGAASQKKQAPRRGYRPRLEVLEDRRLLASNINFALAFGSEGREEIRGMATDTDGNVYVAGAFSGTIDLAGASLFNSGGTDIFVAKFSPGGTNLWTRRAGEGSFDSATAIAVNSTGVYVTGYFGGANVDFDPASNAQHKLSSSGGDDVFVWKLTQDGDFVFAIRAGGSGFDQGTAIDADGDIAYVAGTFEGTASLGSTSFTATAGATNVFMARVNSTDGTFSHPKQLAGAEFVNDITVRNSRVILTGAFAGVADFDPNPIAKAKFNLTSAGLADIFVARYTSSLEFVWARRIGGAGDDVGNSIDSDFSGNIYVTGNFTGNNVDFNPGAGVNPMSDSGTGDVFVLKLNALGQFTWARRLGGTSALREDARALDVDSSGNVYVTGLFQENADMDPSGLKTFNLTEFSNFGNDIFVVKLNNGGNFVWAVSLGGDLEDFSRAILVSGSDVLVAGHFTSESMDMDPGVADNFDIFNADTGTLDAFLWSLPQSVSYPVSDEMSSSDLTLYKNGDLIELYDNVHSQVVASSLVATTRRVELTLNSLSSATSLTIDLSADFPALPDGLQVFSASGPADRMDWLQIIGETGTNAVYESRASGSFDMDVFMDTGILHLTGSDMEEVIVSHFDKLRFATQTSGHVWFVQEENDAAGDLTASKISDAAGLFAPLTFVDVSEVRLDLAIGERMPPLANRFDQLFIPEGGLQARGLEEFIISTGPGPDEVTMHASNLTLPEGGALAVHFGTGIDFLYVTGSGMTLNATRLTTPEGGLLTFSGLENADLTGNSDDNLLNASLFGGNVVLRGDAGNDVLTGNQKRSRLLGGHGSDVLRGGAGDDSLDGGSGDDVILAGEGANQIFAGTGNDTITTGKGDDVIDAGDGDNTISAGNGNNTVLAFAGDDTVTTGTGSDTINVGDGDNSVQSSDGNDAILAGGGNDTINSGIGDDTIDAADGNNAIDAGTGNDAITTGGGNDHVIAGTGNDTIHAGAGNDVIDAGTGNDALYGGEGIDVLLGGAGNDLLFGDDGDDSLVAGTGNDRLEGGAGNDSMNGGDGNDLLKGDDGDDLLDGGAGNDTMDGCLDLDFFMNIEIFLECFCEDCLAVPTPGQ